MLDIGWSELLLIGVVALIVIGPKDLPHMFHALGRITARARAMAREFSSAMEDAAKSTGLDEAGNALRDVKSLTSKKALGLDALERAAERLLVAKEQLEVFVAGELVAEELRLAQEQLSTITGEFSADDLLGRIFSSFCIGK